MVTIPDAITFLFILVWTVFLTRAAIREYRDGFRELAILPAFAASALWCGLAIAVCVRFGWA